MLGYFKLSHFSELSFDNHKDWFKTNGIFSKDESQLNDSEKEHKFVTYTCYHEGQFGNQLWMFLSGWSCAKVLGRSLYHNCVLARPNIELLKRTFPKIAGEFEYLAPETFKKVRLAPYWHAYINPISLQNISDRYLEVDINGAQNAMYIKSYIGEIRGRLLQFGANITDNGESTIAELTSVKKMNLDNLLCAHIRQTDFVDWGYARNYSDVLQSIKHLANMSSNPRTLLIFGDDPKFMNRILEELKKTGDITKDSFFSTYPKEVDLYLSKRLCKTFILTAERSTFGFWLAFLINNDDVIYYLKEYREGVPTFEQDFPLPWHAVKVTGGNSSLLTKKYR